jgi:hypothetical protein
MLAGKLLVGHALLCAGKRQVVWRSGHMESLSTGVVPLPYPAAECSALLIVDVPRRMGVNASSSARTTRALAAERQFAPLADPSASHFRGLRAGVCAGVGEGSHARPWPLHLPIGPTRESRKQKPHRCSGMFSLRLSNQLKKMPAARCATRSVCKSRSGISSRSMQRMDLFNGAPMPPGTPRGYRRRGWAAACHRLAGFRLASAGAPPLRCTLARRETARDRSACR